MKLTLFCLFAAGIITYGDAVGKAALIQIGVDFGAPFPNRAQQRIMNGVWGSDRAARSSDVAVFNLAHKLFHLVHNECKLGGYSSDLFPEKTIPEGKSSVYGIQSHGFMTGVTCFTKYKSQDGSWFEMQVNNPYIGHNAIKAKSSDNLSVYANLGIGHNNQVRFFVRKR